MLPDHRQKCKQVHVAVIPTDIELQWQSYSIYSLARSVTYLSAVNSVPPNKSIYPLYAAFSEWPSNQSPSLPIAAIGNFN